MIPGMPMGLSKSVARPIVQGQMIIETSYTWTVPDNVTSISVVIVGAGGGGNTSSSQKKGGGGALAYANNIATTPGESLTIDMSSGMALKRGATILCFAENGASSGVGGRASECVGDVAFSGGDGTNYGAGGAAGYSGDGGSGAGNEFLDGAAGSGGGGGGGAGDGSPNGYRGHGGGVGLTGEGANGLGGTGGSSSTQPMIQGKGGSAGTDGNFLSGGGKYGGGGGYSSGGTAAGLAGLRIIWGPGRSFPNNAGDV